MFTDLRFVIFAFILVVSGCKSPGWFDNEEVDLSNDPPLEFVGEVLRVEFCQVKGRKLKAVFRIDSVTAGNYDRNKLVVYTAHPSNTMRGENCHNCPGVDFKVGRTYLVKTCNGRPHGLYLTSSCSGTKVLSGDDL